MKKTISLVLVLLLMISMVPFAAATSDVELHKEKTLPTSEPEYALVTSNDNAATSDQSKPSPEVSTNVENEMAAEGVTTQVQKNKDGTETATQTTVDVTSPKSTCEHEPAGDPTAAVWVSVDGYTHVKALQYVCKKCGSAYLSNTDETALHNFTQSWEPDGSEVKTCSECGYSEIVYSPSTTITHDLTDDVAIDGTGVQSASAAETVYKDETVSEPTEAQWENVASKIKTVIIDNTITRIGDWSLSLLDNLKTVFTGGDNA